MFVLPLGKFRIRIPSLSVGNTVMLLIALYGLSFPKLSAVVCK